MLQPGIYKGGITLETKANGSELIRELKKKGILFVAASGRQYASMKYVLAPVAEDLIFVSENGANITQNEKDLINNVANNSYYIFNISDYGFITLNNDGSYEINKLELE